MRYNSAHIFHWLYLIKIVFFRFRPWMLRGRDRAMSSKNFLDATLGLVWAKTKSSATRKNMASMNYQLKRERPLCNSLSSSSKICSSESSSLPPVSHSSLPSSKTVMRVIYYILKSLPKSWIFSSFTLTFEKKWKFLRIYLIERFSKNILSRLKGSVWAWRLWKVKQIY